MPNVKWEPMNYETLKMIIVAIIIRRVLNVWVASCRQAQVPGSHNVFPEELLVKDPLPVSSLPPCHHCKLHHQVMETLDFHKTKPGVVDVDFKAWDIQLHGMHNIQVPVIIDPGGNIALSGEESARPAPYGSPRSQAGHSSEDTLQNPRHGISLSSPRTLYSGSKILFYLLTRWRQT